jgi:hypothetical protein
MREMGCTACRRIRLKNRLLTAVVLDVRLGGLGGVMVSVFIVPVRSMRVVGCPLVVASLVVLGRLPMVSCRVFMMFGCLYMMLGCFL